MPPIAAAVAVVVAAYLVLVTVVLSYLGFVVAERQDVDVDLVGDESAEESAATAGSVQ